MAARHRFRPILSLLVVLGALTWPTAAGASAEWSVATIPPPAAGTSQYQLFGVSCGSKTTCSAVGSFVDGSSINRAVIERWNGSAWTVVPSPSVGSTTNGVLTAVSCSRTTSCFAVGVTNGAGGVRTLFERWDGTSWQITPSPNPPWVQDITGVSCTSPTFCVAVGNYTGSSTAHTLIEHWNGTKWTIVPSPGLTGPELSAVSCASTTSCLAVGSNTDGIGRTLVEHWDGASWVVVSSPNPGGTNSNQLWSVSCPSTTSCYAVGADFIANKARTLVEHWNGVHVKIVSNPPATGIEDELRAVSCASATSCVAVGLTANGSVPLRTLAERWDGVNWTRVAIADAGATTDDELLAVSCVTATYCFSAGDYMHAGTHHALVERLSSHVGYWMVDQSGNLYDFGDAGVTTPPFPGHPVAMAAVSTSRGQAYWIVDARGAHVQGGLLATVVDAPPPLLPGEVVGAISGTPSAHGYWLFTNFGHVFAYGDAHFYGGMSNTLNEPIVASAVTASGHGYYMVGADGGVFTFGDAQFHGSTASMHLNQPITGIVPTSDDSGYWLVAADGGVFSFHAAFHGSMGGARLSRPIIGMVRYGNGYLMVGSDGGIFDFSDRAFVGSLGGHPPAAPIVGVAAFAD